MKLSLADILLEPIITEKSTALAQHNKCTFRVPHYATKELIKKSFQEVFPGRKVLSIKTLGVKGHKRRTKFGFKLPQDEKKTVITFEGDKIEYFPEAS